MSFPRYNNYKDSGVGWLGEVPNTWGVRRIRHLFEIRKRICGTEGHEVLSITQQGIKAKDIESGDGQLSADYSKYQFVEVGDFAMNHMDLLTGYVDISPVFGVTSPDYRVFAVRDKEVCFDRYYLYLFQAGYKDKIFYAFGQGSSQFGRWRFPTDEFNSFEFPLPAIKEQKEIATFLDYETAKIDALAWIIHEVSSQKSKDALKGMMNTGFARPAFPFGASIA
jgi:type I restriction enzyme S subunit